MSEAESLGNTGIIGGGQCPRCPLTGVGIVTLCKIDDCPFKADTSQPSLPSQDGGKCNCDLDWYEAWTCPEHGRQSRLAAATGVLLSSLLRAARETITTLETERDAWVKRADHWRESFWEAFAREIKFQAIAEQHDPESKALVDKWQQAETDLAALREYVRDDAWGHEEAGLCWCDDGDHVETNEQCSRIYEIVMGRKRLPDTQPGSREITG